MANQLPPQGNSGAAPQKSGGSSVVKILLIVFGVLALCCVCCGGLGYYGFFYAVDQVSKGVSEQADKLPVVQEQLGGLDIEKSQFEMIKSGQVQQDTGKETVVISVVGKNGKTAEIHVVRKEKSAKLIMENGDEFDLGSMNIQ